MSRITDRQFLVKRLNGNQSVQRMVQYGHASGYPNCQYKLDRTDSSEIEVLKWREATHYVNFIPEYVVNNFIQAEVDAAIQDVTDRVAVEALTQYDALTDIVEAREIPRLVRSVSSDLYQILKILKGRYDINDLRFASQIPITKLLKHPKRVLRKLGEEWMSYRYGIMPLVYSYRDAVKAAKRGKEVYTRKSASVVPKPTGVVANKSIVCKITEYVGDTIIRGTVYQYFTWERAAQLASVGFNPLVTLWEEIPYSFVIDWFVNVGDYITRTTSQSMSTNQWACISQRTNLTKRTSVNYPNQDITVSSGLQRCFPWNGAIPPNPPAQTISRPAETQPLYETETQSYSRWLVSLGAARLVVKPNLSWRRLIDAAVMANNQLSALNRYFKGFRH